MKIMLVSTYGVNFDYLYTLLIYTSAISFSIGVVCSGGVEMGVLDECIVAEEIAFGCSGVGTALLANSLAVSCNDSLVIRF